MPIFAKHIGCGTIDELNTLIYTILKYFVGLPSNISPRVSRLSNILRCSTMIGNKWYQDVFVSRIMLQKNYYKPCWKGRFIDGLPPIFAHKVKQVLISANDSLNYDNLAYDNIFNAIKKSNASVRNNKKLLTYQLQIKKKANFRKQNGLPPRSKSTRLNSSHRR